MTETDTNLKSITKKTYSYNDITNTDIKAIYSTIGTTLISQHPTAPRTVFTKQSKQKDKQKYNGKQTEKDLIGKEGIGPAAYLPPRYTLPDGKIVQGKDPLIDAKYNSVPSFSIGKSPRKPIKNPTYEYMRHENNHIDVDRADLTRKKSSPSILIGTARRFSEQPINKIIPGPTYDPVQKPEQRNAPKYSMTARKLSKGQDPMILPTSTTNLVGPGTYFQKVGRSHSTSSLSRIPYDSTIKKQPTATFTKAPRTLTQIKNSVEETYDIKHKTIMAHYDFEYDGGKGYHTGTAYMKKNIISSMCNPLQKNKMGSFTIGRSSRQKQTKIRGTFASTMSNAPQTVKIQMPKF